MSTGRQSIVMTIMMMMMMMSALFFLTTNRWIDGQLDAEMTNYRYRHLRRWRQQRRKAQVDNN